MRNIYRLIIFIPLFMLGCAPNVIDENKVLQKINSLDMDIFSQNGDKIYSITSPYSSYDNKEQKFEFKNTTINIFNGEDTKYIINADESTLSDNNKLLELKGNIKLRELISFLFKNHIYIYMIWLLGKGHNGRWTRAMAKPTSKVVVVGKTKI